MTHQAESPLERHFKRKARQLRREQPVLSHHEALDLIVHEDGYQSWRHFLNSLRYPAIVVPTFSATIRTGWRDSQRRFWVESIDLTLHHALGKLLSRADAVRAIAGHNATIDTELSELFVSSPSYFSGSGRADEETQSAAQDKVASIARKIMFLDATGLKPSHAWKGAMAGFPDQKEGYARLPCFDHERVWRDGQGRYLITSEPYPERLESELESLQKVAQSSGHEVAVAEWPGMHNPESSRERGTRLILVSRVGKGVPLHEILPKINDIPHLHLADTWQGQTRPA
ncbi:hypothetical protein LH452_14925 [Laribacter hongkongensis]|uniref:hypothetical protein n=1 Tax=Laribacter hongkongensis TaxID=168471 RepID=UPI001EFCC39D|nr:hypothetical protein [Laribacter hongkongensis]MCG9060174.1 hypothetical protein [Laribacter hongkongensis]MCG9087294.1 hypothetical protein [Laribacter hongkongensis]